MGRGQHEIGVWQSLVWVTDGILFLHSTRDPRQPKRQEEDEQ